MATVFVEPAAEGPPAKIDRGLRRRRKRTAGHGTSAEKTEAFDWAGREGHSPIIVAPRPARPTKAASIPRATASLAAGFGEPDAAGPLVPQFCRSSLLAIGSGVLADPVERSAHIAPGAPYRATPSDARSPITERAFTAWAVWGGGVSRWRTVARYATTT